MVLGLNQTNHGFCQPCLQTRTNNRILNDISPKICTEEQTLPMYTCKIPSQLRINKCTHVEYTAPTPYTKREAHARSRVMAQT